MLKKKNMHSNIENINKNFFNNFLIATPCCTYTLLFQNCRVLHSHPHLNPKTHPYFIYLKHKYKTKGNARASPSQ